MGTEFWFVLGFSLVALAMGYGWWSGEDEAADPDCGLPEDPLARGLKRFWNRVFWKNPVSLLVVAVVTTPLGGFIVGPILAGRAAEIWATRAGYERPARLGVVVGVVWFAIFALVLVLVVVIHDNFVV